ncbi:alpha/beta fold hydrolase [Metamycoplasma neophronis]|uniref:Alpha/beta hydrolase n=1 Tax=Metamycoplasma neophronis TaxID=872983 RepID=A0ABY2Z0M6_9BACT|nr:alpha/beta hydrolase [Metamycoplasma neophronis]TPR54708.1 alpha/beta hydrolase [Metamycoplasma neophronis]
MIEEKKYQVLNEEINAYVENTGRKYKVLCIHGFGANLHTFHRLIELDDRDFDIAALDLPGCGKSTAHEKITLEYYAQIASEFAKIVEYDNALVLSHSLGAVTALNLLENKTMKYGLLTSPFNYFSYLLSTSWIKKYEEKIYEIKKAKHHLEEGEQAPYLLTAKDYFQGIKSVFKKNMLYTMLIREILNKKYLNNVIKPLFENNLNFSLMQGHSDPVISAESVKQVAFDLNRPILLLDGLGHFIWEDMTEDQFKEAITLIDNICKDIYGL